MKYSRMKSVRVITIIVTLIAVLAAFSTAAANNRVTTNQLAFQNTMRKLWVDHVVWTRLYIISAAADLPDRDLTAQRLLQNQDDIGNAIKPFYGDEAGDRLTELLREHILTAVDILDAAKAGDSEGFEEAAASWYQNADEIASFLNAANPDHWPRAEMREMMREHLDLTLDEASARLSGDFEADIAAFDKIHEQILEMADMLSMGIIHQFPRQFK